VPSLSGEEAAIADLVERHLSALSGLEVTRLEDNVVARSATGAPARVILAGHLDTVPAAGNERARVDAGVLSGVGSADMKGGLAVMLALADRLASVPGGHSTPRRLDVTWIFYTCEEVARERSGLLEIERERPDLLAADAAVVLEPTGGLVEAGCQGVLKVRLRLGGTRAHIARPWSGENAVHRLGPVLELLNRTPQRRPVIDGCEYRESLSAYAVSGGVAGNVVPDLAELAMSRRFAPDQDVDDAIAWLRQLVATVTDPTKDELVLEDAAPAAAPYLDHPLLAALVEASGAPPRAKLGWTDVATFAALGVPAANFGPGDPLLAHSAGEHVSAAELAQAFTALDHLLAAPG
jgi:succinyl-diaminopimelate desuccinylase